MDEILLVEDNPDDVELTLRAFRKARSNEVCRAGRRKFYLFATGLTPTGQQLAAAIGALDLSCRASTGCRSSSASAPIRKRSCCPSS
jgi:hypothetical protein